MKETSKKKLIIKDFELLAEGHDISCENLQTKCEPSAQVSVAVTLTIT